MNSKTKIFKLLYRVLRWCFISEMQPLFTFIKIILACLPNGITSRLIEIFIRTYVFLFLGRLEKTPFEAVTEISRQWMCRFMCQLHLTKISEHMLHGWSIKACRRYLDTVNRDCRIQCQCILWCKMGKIPYRIIMINVLNSFETVTKLGKIKISTTILASRLLSPTDFDTRIW